MVDRGKLIINTTHITGKLICNLQFRVMELTRHCLLVISIEICGRDGKAFRTEEDTMECCELCNYVCNPGTNLSSVVSVLKLNFDDEDVGGGGCMRSLKRR